MHPNTPNGFILLEVLVAMSLILGAWMASLATYEGLALRLTQQERGRTELRRGFDAYEMAEQVRANGQQTSNTKITAKGLTHESSRVSGRNRSLRPVAAARTKNER